MRKARVKYKEDIKAYKQNKTLLENKVKGTTKAIGKAAENLKATESDKKKLDDEYKKHQTDLDDLYAIKPQLRRYKINKNSVEKLLLILQENPLGIQLEADEITPMFVKLSKDDNADERALYLSGFNGKNDFSYDTINRGTVLIERLLLSIFGGIQPSKLKRFLNEARMGFQDDGLIQRFQGVVYPDNNPNNIKDIHPSLNLSLAINILFENLDSLPDELRFSFDNESQILFIKWLGDIKKEVEQKNSPFNAHLNKSQEFVAALAVYLYLIENNGTVDKKNNGLLTKLHLLKAISLGEYFYSHAERMYNLVYKENLSARSLATKLVRFVLDKKEKYFNKELKLYSFKRSDISDRGWSDLSTSEERRKGIKDLIDLGYISKYIGGSYYINPKYLDGI